MKDLIKELKQHLQRMAELNASCRGKQYPYTYTCVEDYVLDRGKIPTSSALSDEQYAYLMKVVALSIRDTFPYRQCFFNSQILILADVDNRLEYIEGYCLGSSRIPVHHGWLELDGKVVDVTYSTTDRTLEEEAPEDLRDRILGVIPEGWIYYGVQFDRSEVKSFIFEYKYSDHLIGNYRQMEKTFNKPRLKKDYRYEI